MCTLTVFDLILRESNIMIGWHQVHDERDSYRNVTQLYAPIFICNSFTLMSVCRQCMHSYFNPYCYSVDTLGARGITSENVIYLLFEKPNDGLYIAS